MRIVFFGTSGFSVRALKELLKSSHEIVAVVTRPDIKSGRFLKVSENPVKIFSKNNNLKIFQFAKLDDDAAAKLNELRPDLFVVVSYGRILTKDFLSIPRLYSVNLHASLLPKYRGAGPINWAIINGEKTTGATVMKMNELMDEGDIISSVEVPIDEKDNSITLSDKIAEAGSMLLVDTCDKIAGNADIKFVSQDQVLATIAPKLKKSDGFIDWNKDAYEISNLVRGLLPWPCAYTHYKGKLLKVFDAVPVPIGTEFKNGEVVESGPKGILIKCAKDGLLIRELQLEGKKRMSSKDFLIGNKVAPGDMF